MTRKEDALFLLKIGPRCGQELVEAGVGYRYSGRIYDLRDDGYAIDSTTYCTKHKHKARMALYVLAGWDDGQMEMAL